MKSVTKIQLALVTGALILIVLLLFANTKLPQKLDEPEKEQSHDDVHLSIESIVNSLKEKLQESQKQKAETLEKELTISKDKTSVYKNLVQYWSAELNQPIASAYYSEQLAIADSNETNWLDAANRYLVSSRFTNEHQKTIVINKAIVCFEKALEINPNNIDAKISLASCYVESPQPMKGIGMLREIEKTDSNNVNLQLNFAYFSQRAGEYDRAIKRFEKVLALKPDFIEAYVHIADAYEKTGNKEKAIENLEKYVSLVDDNTIKQEIKKYINELSQGGKQ